MAYKYFRSTEELIAAATKQSQSAPELYRDCVRLYFISRFLVPYYEALMNMAPSAVWNEYRNTLDHFMRYISSGDEDTKNISQMKGHLQRAVLDICKLYCHRLIPLLEEKIEQDTADVLRLVDNGVFYSDLLATIEDLREDFAHVKTEDIQLGNSSDNDENILISYLNACFRVLNTYWQYNEARPRIDAAALQKSNLEASKEAEIKSKKEPFYKKMFEHILGHGLYYILAALVGALIANPTELLALTKSFLSLLPIPG